MLNLQEFSEEGVQETVRKLLNKSDTIRVKGGQAYQINTQTPAALVRMVERCHPGCTYKKNRIHPFIVASIISKATHWHDWSVQTGIWKEEEGEFYKSLKSWEYELSVSRWEVQATEELLKNFSTLTTELRSQPLYNSKYWILNKQRLEDMYTTFALMEALFIAKELPDPLVFVVEKAQKYAQESLFFRRGVEPFLSEFGLKFAENEEGGVCCLTTDPLLSHHRPSVVSPQTLCCLTTDTTINKQEINNENEQANSTTKVVVGRTFGPSPEQPSGEGSLREVPEDPVHLSLRGCSIPAGGEPHPPKLRATPPPQKSPISLACARSEGEAIVAVCEEVVSGLYEPDFIEYEIADGGTMSNLPSDRREGGQNRSEPSKRGLGHSTKPKPVQTPQKRSKMIRATEEELPFLHLVKTWNDLPPIEGFKLTKHTFDNSGYVNKTVKSILERFVIASKGQILTHFPNARMWDNHVDIDIEMVDAPLSMKQMEWIIKTYRKYFDPGFGVHDKTTLKTSLHEFLGLYSAKTRTGEYFESRSWFWQILHRGQYVPTLLNYDVYEQKLKEHPTAVRKFTTFIKNSNQWRPKWEQRIPKILSRLLYTYETIYSNTYLIYHRTSKSADWIELMGRFDTFLGGFMSFVASSYSDPYPGHLDPMGKMFTSFISHGKDLVHIDLEPTEYVAKTMQQNRAVSLYQPKDIVLRNGIQVWYTDEEMKLIESGKYNPWWDLKQIV